MARSRSPCAFPGHADVVCYVTGAVDRRQLIGLQRAACQALLCASSGESEAPCAGLAGRTSTAQGWGAASPEQRQAQRPAPGRKRLSRIESGRRVGGGMVREITFGGF